jgi:uncharacterized protein
MKCPTCPDSTLVMSARDGVEIDYCPSCRGVWLDRGELDKIIERSMQEQAKLQGSPAAVTQVPPQNYRPDFDDSDFSHRKPGYGYGHGKHPKSWLNKIFD